MKNLWLNIIILIIKCEICECHKLKDEQYIFLLLKISFYLWQQNYLFYKIFFLYFLNPNTRAENVWEIGF